MLEDKLGKGQVKVERVERGLDHGVWVGFAAGAQIPFFLSMLQTRIYPSLFSSTKI